MLKDALPEHILRQIEEEREAEGKEQERQEWERNLCKVGVADGHSLHIVGVAVMLTLYIHTYTVSSFLSASCLERTSGETS